MDAYLFINNRKVCMALIDRTSGEAIGGHIVWNNGKYIDGGESLASWPQAADMENEIVSFLRSHSESQVLDLPARGYLSDLGNLYDTDSNSRIKTFEGWFGVPASQIRYYIITKSTSALDWPE